MTDPLALLARIAPEGVPDIAAVFLTLVTLIVAARVGGALLQRLGQPAVLGELLAGIVIGPSLLALVQGTDPAVHVLAELGLVILLFQIGLHTDLADLLKVGPAAGVVGVAGVVLPFALGYGAATLLGAAGVTAIVCGAAMTATSIGISARILNDLGRLHSREGKTVLGAAVLDDVVGLIILAVVGIIATGGMVSTSTVMWTIGRAVGFLVVALLLGRFLAPPLFGWIANHSAAGVLGALALAFALLLAALADAAGSALIIGAFAAGVVLHETPQRQDVEASLAPVGHFFVPVFFATVGAAVDVRAMLQPEALVLGVTLLAVGIVTKFAAGFVPFWVPMRHAVVGAAMVPRGEVGLIFAQMGLATAALSAQQFGAVMLMVIGTTVVTPPWLAWLARRETGSARK